MASQERFYEKVIDRTPYGTCYVVAFIAIALFIVLSVGIWKGGSFIHRSGFFGLIKSTGNSVVENSSDEASRIIKDAQSKVGESAGNAADSLTEQAERKATEAVQDSIDEQKASLEKAATDRLNEVRSPLPKLP